MLDQTQPGHLKTHNCSTKHQAQNIGQVNHRLVWHHAIMGFANEKVGWAYQRAWELCRSGGDYIKRSTTLKLLISYYANIADFESAETMLSLLKISYDEVDEVVPEFALELHLLCGYIDSLFGRHQSVSDHFKEAVKYYYQITQHTAYTAGARFGMEVGVFCHGWAGLHQNWLGYPE